MEMQARQFIPLMTGRGNARIAALAYSGYEGDASQQSGLEPVGQLLGFPLTEDVVYLIRAGNAEPSHVFYHAD